MSKYIPDSVVMDVVDVILNTRDLCGNERRAAMEHLADEYGIKGEDAKKAYQIANFRANAEWNAAKKEAGVKPKYIF
jgi:uncharacterized NAD-dependent epimerase/dehydratase family protein